MENLITDDLTEFIEGLFDRAGYCYDIEDLIITLETIEDFRSARLGYAEKGSVCDRTEFEGHPVFEVDDVQANKGERRVSLIVIDMGDYRVVSAN